MATAFVLVQLDHFRWSITLPASAQVRMIYRGVYSLRPQLMAKVRELLAVAIAGIARAATRAATRNARMNDRRMGWRISRLPPERVGVRYREACR